MSSEFLVAVPHELPKNNSLMNTNSERNMFDINYGENYVKHVLPVTAPGFSCIKNLQNFPFTQEMKFPDVVPTKRRLPDDEMEESCSKQVKLESENTQYHSESVSAVDGQDSVVSAVIKNDVILGEGLDDHSVTNSVRANGLMEVRDLQLLLSETPDASGGQDHAKANAIGVPSDRKSSDEQQGLSNLETQNALFEMQGLGSTASHTVDQECVTESDNLLLASEGAVLFVHEYMEGRAETDENHGAQDSFSLSDFLIYPPELEQKGSNNTVLHSVQQEESYEKEETQKSNVSLDAKRIDSIFMTHCANAIIRHASTSFAPNKKSSAKDVSDSTTESLMCEPQKLSQVVQEVNCANSLKNEVTQSQGMTQNQTPVKTEKIFIKEEVEECPPSNDAMASNPENLHNHEFDLMDDATFKNWLVSFVDQEAAAENISHRAYSDQIVSDARHVEDLHDKVTQQENTTPTENLAADKESDIENGNKIPYKMLPSSVATGDLETEQNNYADGSDNCTEDTFTPKFLRSWFPTLPDLPLIQNVDLRFGTEDEGLVSTSSSTNVPPEVAVAQKSVSILRPVESKLTNADSNSAKQPPDNNYKNHKKEIIKKFSSGLLKDSRCDSPRILQGHKLRTESTVQNTDIPSTSTVATNEDQHVTNEKNSVDDCIVISDSDDSVIEFDIVQTRTKKYHKRAFSASSSKSTQMNSRKCGRHVRPSPNEDVSEQQTKNPSSKSNTMKECIVLSDSDDELPQSASPSRSRSSCVFDQETSSTSNGESIVASSGGDAATKIRQEGQGVIDLSGGSRTSVAMPRRNDDGAALDINTDARASLGTNFNIEPFDIEKFDAVTYGLLTVATLHDQMRVRRRKHNGRHHHHRNMHIQARIMQGSSGRESTSNGVIDLSRTSSACRNSSAQDVLDLSGNDRKQQERNSVITSVKSVTECSPAVKDDKDTSPAWSCPICFESLLSNQSVSSTPCGHVFCTKCIEEAVNQFKKCPTCCRKVVLKRVHKIFL